MHQSIATIKNPEFINLQPLDINPLMSACEIKVLYLGENRNHSYIDKEAALKMAKTLRGAPIVGYYKSEKEDFVDHGEKVTFEGGEVTFDCLTVPYGFVSPDARVWFQEFVDVDDFGNEIPHEYLMTTGYLWTGQQEEAKLPIEEGRPHSMELDEDLTEGHWATNNKTGMEFFIINDSVFSKLCILGNDVEPCFEGSSVTKPVQSAKFTKVVDDNFKATLYSMMKDLQKALEGGQPMTTQEMVESTNEEFNLKFDEGGEGGDAETSEADAEAAEAAEAAAEAETASDVADDIADIAEDILGTPATADTPEVNPSIEGDAGQVAAEALADTAQAQATIAQEQADIAAAAAEKEDATEAADASAEDAQASADAAAENVEDALEALDTVVAIANDIQGSDAAGAKKRDFAAEYAELEAKYNALVTELAELQQYKLKIENEEKDKLFKKFAMIPDELKKELIDNKSKYSLAEIKSQLSILYCDTFVAKEDDENDVNNVEKSTTSPVTTFNLNNCQPPVVKEGWLKAVLETRDNRN